MAAVALAQVVGQERLVAKAWIVDKRNARNPVAVVEFAAALDVVLAAGEVPHEVAPVHVVKLIIKEELKVLGESRLYACAGLDGVAVGVDACGGFHLITFHAYPFLVL